VSILSSVGDFLVLGLFLAAAVAQVVLAVRAGRVEREEGLPRSRYRIPAAIVVCLLVGILVVLSALPSTGAAPGPSPKDSRPDLPKPSAPATRPGPDAGQRAKLEDERAGLVKQLDVVEKQIQQLNEGQERDRLKQQIRDVDKRIAALDRGAPADQPADQAPGDVAPAAGLLAVWESFDFRLVARILAPVLVLVGFVLLFYLGDPWVFLRLKAFGIGGGSGQLRDKALADLDALAAAADSGRFRDGLAIADALDVNLLDRFDRLDWTYLRSYCAVQLSTDKTVAGEERQRLLEAAERALTTLLAEAPNRGEAVYLLALAQHLLGRAKEALEGFTWAESALPAALGLPFAHNKSVSLLTLAEERLGQGDAEGAGELFDRVTQLKVLVEKIPVALVKSRLLNVRRCLQENRLPDATRGLEAVRNLEGLDEAQRRNVLAMCDALQTLICVRGGDDAQIAGQLDGFLAAHLPPDLPEPDDALADEYLDAPLAGVELRIAPQIYRSFFFLKAEGTARALSKQGRPLTAAQVEAVSRPLLRALQFELRQRDVLAVLGGLFWWFVPEKKRRAVGWLEAAVALGVESRIARRLLEAIRQLEVENRQALDWFRSTATRFLHDPTVSGQVRDALFEELGRFQGFQPLLLGLDMDADFQPQEPTLSLVRERADYLEKMVAEFAAQKAGVLDPELDQLRKDYAGLVGTLSASLGQITDVERRLVQAIGKTILT
jgi:hypothetical protein